MISHGKLEPGLLRRLLLSLLTLGLVFSLFAQFGGGEGTEEDPWQIETAEHLNNIRNFMGSAHTNKFYIMTADIDLGVAPWNEGDGWAPIGTSATNCFYGHLDGRGHIISNLTINRNSQYQALFYYLRDATVKNVGLKDVNITGTNYVAGFTGYQRSSTIESCYVTGTITGVNYVAGFAGYVRYAAVRIIDSYSNATIITTGTATNHYAGGIVGYLYQGDVIGCYTVGAVQTIVNSGNVGALIGNYRTGNHSNNYWNTDTIALTRGIGNVADSPGQTVLQLIRRDTFEGFDFENIWRIDEGESYPYFQWQGDEAEDHNLKHLLPPQNLEAAGGDNIVNLTWSLPPLEQGAPDGYNVYRNSERINEQLVTVRNYQDTGLTNWTEYFYYVTSVYDEHESLPTVTIQAVPGSFGGGDGSIDDPFIITNAEQLAGVRFTLTAHFIQTENIDLNLPPFNEGEGWIPIGSDAAGNRFTGTFNGNGHTIANLYINREGTNYQGLFGYVQGSTLQNIHLENVNVIGRQNVAGLTSYQHESRILNCSSSGNVVGSSYVGGLIGYRRYGNAESNILMQSYSTANVVGQSFTGGLVGGSWTGHIISCWASGNVSGGDVLGGLAGLARHTDETRNSYATGNVQAANYGGGLFGNMAGNGTVVNCYSIGRVEVPGAFFGGLIGTNPGEVTNSYWNVETSGQETSPAGIGRATREMVLRNNYEGWDFDEVWSIVDGASYPKLQWQEEIVIPAPRNLFGYSGVTETIFLSWQPPAVAIQPTGYNLYRDGVLVNDELIENAQYQDTGLNNFQYYTYYVTAVFEIGESLPSVHYRGAPVVFAGGNGLEDNPYLIETAEHLNNVRYALDAHFQQIANIDLGVAPWNQNGGWVPIGAEEVINRFSGVYDGNNFEVLNMFINRVDGTYQGLFGYIQGAELKHIKVLNINMTALEYMGALAAYQHDSRIINCSSSGTIVGTENLFGSYVGGLVGQRRYGTAESNALINSYSTVNVSGTSYVGGIAGYSHHGDIISCWSSGNVIGSYSGGFVGYVREDVTIRDSYAKGNVTGVNQWSRDLGGFVGNNQGGTIRNSYSTGRVSGTENNIGGFIGANTGQAVNSYWDVQTSQIEFSAGGEGRLTAHMTYPYVDTYINWDFDNVWRHDTEGTINNGYPVLRYDVSALAAPVVAINIIEIENMQHIRLSWELVTGALSYRIYSSNYAYAEDWGDPVAIVGEDVSHYVEPINRTEMKYYYIIASPEPIEE